MCVCVCQLSVSVEYVGECVLYVSVFCMSVSVLYVGECVCISVSVLYVSVFCMSVGMFCMSLKVHLDVGESLFCMLVKVCFMCQ